MYCANCAAEMADGAQFCQRCGWDARQSPAPGAIAVPDPGPRPALGTVSVSFVGSALEFFGWMLLTILSALVVIPLAWTYAAMARWFARNLKFSAGP